MILENSDIENPFVLKRHGKFNAAISAYVRRYSEALREGNEYIAQMCFDQMVDIRLLELLKEGRKFNTLPALKRSVEDYLAKVLQNSELYEETFHEHFGRSWEKISRQQDGHALFSVRREQLVHSRSGSEGEYV